MQGFPGLYFRRGSAHQASDEAGEDSDPRHEMTPGEALIVETAISQRYPEEKISSS